MVATPPLAPINQSPIRGMRRGLRLEDERRDFVTNYAIYLSGGEGGTAGAGRKSAAEVGGRVATNGTPFRGTWMRTREEL